MFLFLVHIKLGNENEEDNVPSGVTTRIVVVLCALAVIVLVAIVLYRKTANKLRRKKNNHNGEEVFENGHETISLAGGFEIEQSNKEAENDQCNRIKTNKGIKFHANLLSYDTKREISRSLFTVTDQLGSGNFGIVYKGELKELYGNDSKTTVAIKSVSGPPDGSEHRDFLQEIKIMSYINPHLNLVSMIGSCCSDTEKDREMWLIIEFCPHGDMRTFLVENRTQILSGNKDDSINSRCLINWAYEVSKGMEYLSENKIMHGDLAARNILLDDNLIQNGRPIAKIADFGLSKKFYYNKNYEKENRVLVPWKWMALEYLTRDYFTLTSDVWSFGVLLWEIFSCGRVPYGHKCYDQVLKNLERGDRLQCPKDIDVVTDWSPGNLYKDLSTVCFRQDPNERASFSCVVNMIEKDLTNEEKSVYQDLNSKYLDERAKKYIKLGQRKVSTF